MNVSTALPASPPIGYVLNNPGDMRWSGVHWRGLDAAAPHVKGWCHFASMGWGCRAHIDNLHSYRFADGLESVGEWITRWAPPVENDTDEYIARVSAIAGVTADTVVDWSTAAPIAEVGRAMAIVEIGAGWAPPVATYQHAYLVLRGEFEAVGRPFTSA